MRRAGEERRRQEKRAEDWRRKEKKTEEQGRAVKHSDGIFSLEEALFLASQVIQSASVIRFHTNCINDSSRPFPCGKKGLPVIRWWVLGFFAEIA